MCFYQIGFKINLYTDFYKDFKFIKINKYYLDRLFYFKKSSGKNTEDIIIHL